MFLEVGEVVAHRAAADRVGCTMCSDRGGDGVAFKRLGIRVYLRQSASASPIVTSSRCCVQRIPRRREPKLGGALGRAAGSARHRKTRRGPVTACPPARPPGPAKQPTAGNSNEKGGRGQDTNYGHLATYSARLPNHLPPQPPENSPAADESAEIGEGGQNSVVPHSVRASLTTRQTNGKCCRSQQTGSACRQRPGSGTPLPARRVARSVHVWSTRHRSRAVRNGLLRCPAVGRSPRSQARSWGNRLGGRTLIRMRSPGSSPGRPTNHFRSSRPPRPIIGAGPSGAAPVHATREQESANSVVR
jgi:hypothetical protein